jgi:hypothetical protein
MQIIIVLARSSHLPETVKPRRFRRRLHAPLQDAAHGLHLALPRPAAVAISSGLLPDR